MWNGISVHAIHTMMICVITKTTIQKLQKKHITGKLHQHMVDIITPQKRLQWKQKKYTDSVAFISIYAIKNMRFVYCSLPPFLFFYFLTFGTLYLI